MGGEMRMKICTYSLFAQYLDALMGHPQTNGTVALLVRKYDAVTGLSLRLKMWHIWCKGKKTWCMPIAPLCFSFYLIITFTVMIYSSY